MPYRSPSFSSFSGGADMRGKLPAGANQRKAEKARRAKESDAFNAWREATVRAAEELQNKAKGDAVAGRPYKTRKVKNKRTGETETRFVVSRDELDALTEKYFNQAGFQRNKDRQSRAARHQRVHGLPTSKLHQPVSRAEAVQLFLDGYRKQATEGHRTNPSGNRRYPSKGPVAENLRRAGKGHLVGQPIPDRAEKDFKDARTALRTRMRRSAGVSPDAKGRVHGRKVIQACPPEAVGKSGTVSRAAAKKYNCEDSWKLRRRRAWKNYQVPGVTHWSSSEDVSKSPLYKAAKNLPRDESRVYADPTWLKDYPRFKKNEVVSPGVKQGALRAYYERHGNPVREGQSIDQYRERRKGQRKQAAKARRARSSSASPSAETFDDLFA